ncbi:hypothetical protein ETD96_17290 [Actinomadura geliboluensis]|uniref:Uncharacterized protein n=1 Tax=Actinomadura geliboluensis TaxID=882440 RepID=A0A5S4GYD9_9ACTN|nr:hypothetical protein ETD96_17290 [Actinomadura geliboluensis]
MFNLPLQAAVWFGVIGLPMTATNLTGFAMFAALLLVGAAYWSAKLRQLSTPSRTLPGAGAFAIARIAIAVLLAAGVSFLVGRVVTVPGAGSWPGLAFGLFAVLEYVNYFHVQLMYDTTEDLRYLRSHGLRRAHLSRDLHLARKSRQAHP